MFDRHTDPVTVLAQSQPAPRSAHHRTFDLALVTSLRLPCFLAAAPEESLTAPCLRQLDSKPYLFFIWLHCAACGILVPRPGIELMLPGAEAQSPDHWMKGVSGTRNLEEVEGGEVGCSASSSSILSQSTAFFLIAV